MDLEKKFNILSNIMRASHFEWRRAVLKLCPDLDPLELVKAYWNEVGLDTAGYYLKKIDPTKDIAAQVARLYVSSSVAMGEDAEVVEDSKAGVTFARHNDCPWFHWHKKENLLLEDLPGCNSWLETVVSEINNELNCNLQVKTVSSLPESDGCCLRKFWTE